MLCLFTYIFFDLYAPNEIIHFLRETTKDFFLDFISLFSVIIHFVKLILTFSLYYLSKLFSIKSSRRTKLLTFLRFLWRFWNLSCLWKAVFLHKQIITTCVYLLQKWWDVTLKWLLKYILISVYRLQLNDNFKLCWLLTFDLFVLNFRMSFV